MKLCSLALEYVLRNGSVVSAATVGGCHYCYTVTIELLRCYAEGILMEMVQLLFSNLANLNEEDNDQYQSRVVLLLLLLLLLLIIIVLQAAGIVMAPSEDDNISSAVDTEGEESAPPPHGVVCVREVLRFLVSITDPRDSGNSSRLIATGLGLIHVALEVGCQHTTP